MENHSLLRRALAPKHRYLHLSIVFFLLPTLYSVFFGSNRRGAYSVEESLYLAWEKNIKFPGAPFKKVVVGFNANIDLIVPATSVIDNLNTSCTVGQDHEHLESLTELHETFIHFFEKGKSAERHMSSEESFKQVVNEAEKDRRAQYLIGGNAAIMSERIVTNFPTTEVHLVGPIGPRSQALLHEFVKRSNSTRIGKDELHVILEYKQGEFVGDSVAPSSNRFITSHDYFSGSTVVIEMFFKAIQSVKPDLVILSGVHQLEFQDPDARLEKVRLLRRNLLQISPRLPIHLELGGLGDKNFVLDILERMLPHVDSLGITEQELAFVSHVAGGPHKDEYPPKVRTIHAHKAVDILHWLLKTYGRDLSGSRPSNAAYRLQRIHFHCLTYHLMVSIGNDWSNLASALAAGARVAGRSCDRNHGTFDSEQLEIRVQSSFHLDKQLEKIYTFQAHNPMQSWMRDDMLFIFTPVLVCKVPSKTVGLDDAISAQALLLSQFYHFHKN